MNKHIHMSSKYDEENGGRPRFGIANPSCTNHVFNIPGEVGAELNISILDHLPCSRNRELRENKKNQKPKKATQT